MEKNIILVTIDCLRYDKCGFNGYHLPTTPNLDSLATQSEVYDYAYSTGSFTPESFPGILAGLNSKNSAYYDESIWKALPRESPTLASELQAQGYNTFATITNPHLIEERNFDIGFERFINLRSQTKGDKIGVNMGNEQHKLSDRLSEWFREFLYGIRENMRDNVGKKLNPYTIPFIGYRYYQTQFGWPLISANDVVDRFKQEVNDTQTPFFSWVHFMDLHGPIHPDTVNSSPYPYSKTGMRQFMYDSRRAGNVHEPNFGMMYDAALRSVDESIREIIRKLKDIGVYQNTTLIITSDHGEALFDRGYYGHYRDYLYDELLHVPLLIHSPGRPGDRNPSLFSLQNLYEIVSRHAPEELKLNQESAHSEAGIVYSDCLTEQGHTVAIRDESWKYIITTDESSEFHRTSGELFNYKSDKTERDQKVSENHHLIDLAEDYLTDEAALSPLRGELDGNLKNQLANLGYRA